MNNCPKCNATVNPQYRFCTACGAKLEGLSQDNVSQDSVSQDNVPQDSVSQDSVSQDSVSQDSVSQDSVSQDSVSQDTGHIEVPPMKTADNKDPFREVTDEMNKVEEPTADNQANNIYQQPNQNWQNNQQPNQNWQNNQQPNQNWQNNQQPNQNWQNNQQPNQGWQNNPMGAPFNQFNPIMINNTPYIVWSIVLLVCCCWPLAIWALILSITAKNAPTYEEAMKKLNTAKTILIVGGIIGFILNIIILVASFSQGYYMY